MVRGRQAPIQHGEEHDSVSCRPREGLAKALKVHDLQAFTVTKRDSVKSIRKKLEDPFCIGQSHGQSAEFSQVNLDRCTIRAGFLQEGLGLAISVLHGTVLIGFPY